MGKVVARMVREFPKLTAAEAASLVQDGETIGLGGFTTAGTPKALTEALAARADAERAAGRPFALEAIGVATGPLVEGHLGRFAAFRTPYQSDAASRARTNAGECRFIDMHLSHVTRALRQGVFGQLDWALVEAADVSPGGEIVLTSGVGAAPTICARAKRVLIECNRRQPERLRGIHDIYEPAEPPHSREIPIYNVRDRIGTETLHVNPEKIAGVVESEREDEGSPFSAPSAVTGQIGANVAEFLAAQLRKGPMPQGLPVQSGVGDIANSVLGAMGSHPDIPPFTMYTEIVQDAVLGLMRAGRVLFASCCSLTVSRAALAEVYANLEWYRTRFVLRPQEITNHPEVVRRLGLITINTALEADIFGNVNSTHVLGRDMMNGIGGSGDFTRNAYLSMFTCPSTAKAGRISTIVPMVTHTDHSEHSVQVLATEWGVADLRGRSPRERARLVIERCAHPDFRDTLSRYLAVAGGGHTPHTLAEAFALHERFRRTGDMRP